MEKKEREALDEKTLRGAVVKLDALSKTPAKALLFQLLTAARMSEVLGARRDDLDLEAGAWNIRGRVGGPRSLPLSDKARGLVTDAALAAQESAFLFPGRDGKSPIASTALSRLMNDIGLDGVAPHVLRKTFSEWASRTGSYTSDVVETALGHKVIGYSNPDPELVRALMNAWASHCYGVSTKS